MNRVICHVMADMRFDYQTFTPAETERIAGVVVATQRNWRRLGHVSSVGEGWNRFPAHDLAFYLVMSKLAAMSIPAAWAKEVASHAAQRVMIFALEQPGAAVDENGVEAVERPIKLPLDYNRHFMAATAKRIEAVDSIEAFIKLHSPNGEAVVVLDLEQLGKHLAHSAGRPLVIHRLIA